MHYVYLLQSESCPEQQYVGCTAQLRARLAAHNAGKSAHASKFTPWRLVTYIAFSEEEQALLFERYLKSGRATRLPKGAFGERRGWLPLTWHLPLPFMATLRSG